MRKSLADANLSFQITVFNHHAYLRRSTPKQKTQKQHDSMALVTFTCSWENTHKNATKRGSVL